MPIAFPLGMDDDDKKLELEHRESLAQFGEKVQAVVIAWWAAGPSEDMISLAHQLIDKTDEYPDLFPPEVYPK